MKKMKCTLSVLVVLALLLAAFPLTTYGAGNYNWEVGQAVNERLDAPLATLIAYDCTRTDGLLPDGISISPGPATEFYLVGSPTTTGSGSFTLQFTDTSGQGNPPVIVDFYWVVRGPQGPGNPRQDDDYEPICYTIDSRAGAGGNIAPEGKVEVEEQGRKSYLIYPDDGYVIDRVLVDGKNVGPVERYVFENVIANHTIEAYFRSENPASESAPASTSPPPPESESTTHNPDTGAQAGPAGEALSLGAALLLLGGGWLLQKKSGK